MQRLHLLYFLHIIEYTYNFMHQNVYAFAFPFFLFLLYFPSFKIEILEHTQWQKLHDFYLCYFFLDIISIQQLLILHLILFLVETYCHDEYLSLDIAIYFDLIKIHCQV